MTEKYEDANSIMSDLESQMALANLIKRGEYAAGIAVLSGDVLKSALAAGVPYAMAEEMAGDFWKAEMLADTVAGLLRNVEFEEDETE
jgi:glycerol-3-phosphate acyltransferase PlsY